ncbi:MAG: electron transfer flavoprotein subunit beta [Thermoplasmata archaeon]|nr:electron transfer flavoprotein subunit beta [Thermoplasmata archaeon]
MEIVVCVKPVPDAEARLRARADGSRLEEEGVKFVLGGYDESAVEQALLLREGGAVTAVRAVSVGPGPRTEEVLRASLALGCDTASWLDAGSAVALDAIGLAKVLAAVVQRYSHDLVLVGRQAGDGEAGLVGPALAECLGLPDFPAVVDLRWDATRRTFAFQQAVEGASLRVEAPAPLLVTLQQAWNDPRTAKLPNILKSRKAPIEKIPWAEVAASLGDRSARFARATKFRLPPPRTGVPLPLRVPGAGSRPRSLPPAAHAGSAALADGILGL